MNGVEEQSQSRAENFVQSEVFARTFREGMELVEETANYLDGEGRENSKSLPKDAAMSYASASMRLTTQLMQIASWLLVLRAVREGEMSLEEASHDKYRIENNEEQPPNLAGEGLPELLTGLIAATHHLYARISRLDRDLFSKAAESKTDNHAISQQRALMQAFKSGA